MGDRSLRPSPPPPAGEGRGGGYHRRPRTAPPQGRRAPPPCPPPQAGEGSVADFLAWWCAPARWLSLPQGERDSQRRWAMKRLATDILILGSGGAGLFAALHAKKAAPGLSVTVAV